MRRVREERKLLCVGVDLPIDAGTCGRFVHAGYQRCVHTLPESLLQPRLSDPRVCRHLAAIQQSAATGES